MSFTTEGNAAWGPLPVRRDIPYVPPRNGVKFHVHARQGMPVERGQFTDARAGIGATPQPWMRHGACRNEDPDMFFTDDGSGDDAAVEVCYRACPVRTACLRYALERRIPFGVWGGLTTDERRYLAGRRRELRRAAT